MRRILRGIEHAALPILVTMLAVSCAPVLYADSGASTYFGFTIGVESAPPPPRLHFRERPRYERVERSSVRVVVSPDPGCDLFAYGGGYYLFTDGYWYRSSRYDGPYRVVEVHRVPRAVLTVPEQHWHHRPHWAQEDEDGHGRGRGHGHGRD